MAVHLQHIFTFLFLALIVASHATHTSEDYWKSVLPNIPMPKAITNLLHPDWMEGNSVNSIDVKRPGGMILIESYFFLEKDLHPGTKLNTYFPKSDVPFLPRKVAQSIPFSSKKLPEIFNRYSVKPDSIEAKILNKTMQKCEMPPYEGEKKTCATSLESIIDFSISILGKKVYAISTAIIKEPALQQKYSIVGVKSIAADKPTVSCHKVNYLYAVFNCHKLLESTNYMVSLVGANGAKVKALTVCHDTAGWNPKFFAFRNLKFKPGTLRLCHFLPEADLIWVPY